MMEREQIVKALEICSDETKKFCTGCPFIGNGGCEQSSILKLALALIKELIEENKRIQADTVRKMQGRLNEAFNKHYPQRCGECCKEKVDQIAKEMLEVK